MKNLDFAVLLFDADRLQYFDDALLIVGKICSLKYFGVLAAAQLVVDVVVVKRGPIESQTLIV